MLEERQIFCSLTQKRKVGIQIVKNKVHYSALVPLNDGFAATSAARNLNAF